MSKMKLIEHQTKLDPFIFITEKLTLSAPVVNIMIMIFLIKFNNACGRTLMNQSFIETLTNEETQIQNVLNQTRLTEKDRRKIELDLEYNYTVTDNFNKDFISQSLQCLQKRSNSKNMAQPLINNSIIMRNKLLNDVKFHAQTEVGRKNLAINFTSFPLYSEKNFVLNNNIKRSSSLKSKKEILVAETMSSSKKSIPKALIYFKPDRIPHSSNILHNKSLQNKYSQSQKNKTQDLVATKWKLTAYNSSKRLPQLKLNASRMFCHKIMTGYNPELNSSKMFNLRSRVNFVNSRFVTNGTIKPSSSINNIIRKVREIKRIGNYSLFKESLQNYLWNYNTNRTRNGFCKMNRVSPKKMIAHFSRMLIVNTSPKTAQNSTNITKTINKLHNLDLNSHYKSLINTVIDLPINKSNIDLGKIVKKRQVRQNTMSVKNVKYKYFGNPNKQRVLYIKKAITTTFTSRKPKLHYKPEFKNYKTHFSTQESKLFGFSSSRAVLNVSSSFINSSRNNLKQQKSPIDNEYMEDFNNLFFEQYRNNQMRVKSVRDRSIAYSKPPLVINTKKVFGKTDIFFLTMGKELLNKYIYERKGTTRKANFRLREVEFPKRYRNVFGLDEDDDEGFEDYYVLLRWNYYDIGRNNYSREDAYRYRGGHKYYTWKSGWMNKINNVVVINFPTTGVKKMRLGTEPAVYVPLEPLPILKQQCVMEHEIVFALFTLAGCSLLFLSCCIYATIRVVKKRNKNLKKYEYLTRITRCEKKKKEKANLSLACKDDEKPT